MQNSPCVGISLAIKLINVSLCDITTMRSIHISLYVSLSATENARQSIQGVRKKNKAEKFGNLNYYI